MSIWHNSTGRPLSSTAWLEAHHRAKLKERSKFCDTILATGPSTILDLGCGPGLWLDLISRKVDSNCRLVGVDSDPEVITEAVGRATSWPCEASFQVVNFAKELSKLPTADLILVFNVLPYVSEASALLSSLREKLTNNGRIIIRQYDGSSIRFGPMPDRLRLKMENAVHAAIDGSSSFRHYDLDRAFAAISTEESKIHTCRFETFQRISPFPEDFTPYFENTIRWLLSNLGESAEVALQDWFNIYINLAKHRVGTYFVESDLVASIS